MPKTEKAENGKRHTLKNIMKKFSRKQIILAVAVIAVVIIFLLFKFSPSIFQHKEKMLESGLKNVGELITQEWYGRVIEDSSEDRKIFNVHIPFTESRVIFSLDVEASASINFTEIEYSQIGENTVKIRLPKAKLNKCYQVPDTFEVYLDKESLFTNLGAEVRHNLEDEVVEKGKQMALDSGLLDKADENAKRMIEQVVKANNKEINIEWEYKE